MHLCKILRLRHHAGRALSLQKHLLRSPTRWVAISGYRHHQSKSIHETAIENLQAVIVLDFLVVVTAR